MKTKYSKSQLILPISILFLFFFTSCEKDLYEDANTSNKITSERVSFENVMREIQNPLIKEVMQNDIRQQLNLSTSRTGIYDFIFFNKIIKDNDYTTYTLLVNQYSAQKPYFLYFVIKKIGNDEKAGYTKYIPEEAISNLNPNTFSGKIQLLDIEQHIKGEDDFEQGVQLERMAATTSCTNHIYITVYNCTQGGNHAPGDNSCVNNNGYYQITIQEICSQSYTLVAAPDNVMGEYGGGGGPDLSQSDIAFIQFLAGLNEQQTDVLATTPGLIDYIRSNDVSQESQGIALQLINIAIAYGLQINFYPQTNGGNQIFTSLDEFNNYVEEMSADNYDDSVGTVVLVNQNQRFSTKTIEFSPIIDLAIEIVSKNQPTFSLVTADCKSFISNVVVGNTWVQNSVIISNMNATQEFAEITIVGYNNIGVKIEGLEFGIKQRRKIKLLINKASGEICCSSITTIR